MRINNQHKQEFINSVMAKVPEIDYEQKARDLIMKIALESLPEPVRKIYDDPSTKDYVSTVYSSVVESLELNGRRRLCVSVRTPFVGEHVFSENSDGTKKVKVLIRKAIEQDNQRSELTQKLRCATNGVKNLKTLKDLLPEFIEFMPEEGKPTKNLPSVLGLKAEFEAAGLKLKELSEQ